MTSLQQEITNWIQLIRDEGDVPPPGIVAFNFGLFETEEGFGVYLMGSKDYDAEDDDWACREDYTPKNRRYMFVEVTIEDKNWEEFLELMAEELRAFKETSDFQDSFLATAEVITTGFDDGELYVI